MTQPHLANQLDVTQQAINHFNTAEQNAMRIHGQVNDAMVLLTSRAMVSMSGTQFGTAVGQWLEQFAVVTKALNVFEQNMGDTVNKLRQNEQANSQAPGSIINELGTVRY